MKEKEKQILEIITCSPKETAHLGNCIGEVIREGDILALSGELGSGKTCFTGGLASGLGISDQYPITSPTFTLINEYTGRCKLYHFDVYRLQGYEDLDDLGYEEYFSGKGVLVIEWAEKIDQVIPDDAFRIYFEYIDENKRKIVISGLKQRLDEFIIDQKSGG
jgi:tRNA threonylcarbamoyladenosine biosynthesis protein TsaE